MYVLIYEDRLDYLPIMGFSPLIFKYGITCSDHSSPLYLRAVFLRADIKVGRREPGTLGAPAACWLPTGTGNISTLWSRESLKSLDYRARGILA